MGTQWVSGILSFLETLVCLLKNATHVAPLYVAPALQEWADEKVHTVHHSTCTLEVVEDRPYRTLGSTQGLLCN